MEILNFEDLGDTSVVSECSLGVNLIIDNFCIYEFLKLCIIIMLVACPELIHNTESSFLTNIFAIVIVPSRGRPAIGTHTHDPSTLYYQIYLLYLPLFDLILI